MDLVLTGKEESAILHEIVKRYILRTIISKTPLDTITSKYDRVLGWRCYFCNQTRATHLVTYESDSLDKPQTVKACLKHFVIEK